MIYLIGGAPRCGKTILSHRIARHKKISWISTDSLQPVILPYIPKSQVLKKFPYQKVSLQKDKPETLLAAEITESNTTWPGIKALIQHQIDCNQDFIIEGVHLLPGLVYELKRTRYWKNIKLIYLVKIDLEKIKQGFLKNTSTHDWLFSSLKNEEILDKAARMVQIKSQYIATQAKQFDFKVVNMDIDFNKKIKKLAAEI